MFGAGGQVGHESLPRRLARRRSSWCRSTATQATSPKPAAVAAVIARQRPDLVINLAAYTAVDRAESEPELAWAVNCAGAAHHRRRLAATTQTPLIHLSTDYVFDGAKPGPYREDDHGQPARRLRAQQGGRRARRPGGGGAPHHPAHRLGVRRARREFRQDHAAARGRAAGACASSRTSGARPTAAADIASALIAIARQIERGGTDWGTFHFAGAGAHQLARLCRGDCRCWRPGSAPGRADRGRGSSR